MFHTWLDLPRGRLEDSFWIDITPTGFNVKSILGFQAVSGAFGNAIKSLILPSIVLGTIPICG